MTPPESLYAIVTGAEAPGFVTLDRIGDEYIAQGYDLEDQPRPHAMSRHVSIKAADKALSEQYGPYFHHWWRVPEGMDSHTAGRTHHAEAPTRQQYRP